MSGKPSQLEPTGPPPALVIASWTDLPTYLPVPGTLPSPSTLCETSPGAWLRPSSITHTPADPLRWRPTLLIPDLTHVCSLLLVKWNGISPSSKVLVSWLAQCLQGTHPEPQYRPLLLTRSAPSHSPSSFQERPHALDRFPNPQTWPDPSVCRTVLY